MTPEMSPERAVTYMSALKNTINEYLPDEDAQTAFNMAIDALQRHGIKAQRRVLYFDKPVKVSAAIFRAGAKVLKCPKCNTFVLPSHKYYFYCGQAFEEVPHEAR